MNRHITNANLMTCVFFFSGPQSHVGCITWYSVIKHFDNPFSWTFSKILQNFSSGSDILPILKRHVPLFSSLDIPQTPCFAFTSSLLLLIPHVLLSALNLKNVLPHFFLYVFLVLVLKNPNKIVFQYRLMTSLLLPKKDCPLSLCSPKTTAVCPLLVMLVMHVRSIPQ